MRSSPSARSRRRAEATWREPSAGECCIRVNGALRPRVMLARRGQHAHGATGIWIKLNQTRTSLHFEVRDDGLGFPPGQRTGRGLRNMHDRIEAIGGQITAHAKPGHGTRIVGFVQLPRGVARRSP